ncbi:uncharacterized protein LOC131680696 [Topomyia yanbarensis]|uniref:uncharacterized protein LOC131680696 n=1 Tax=Topomyia yanbarensis TaxID=2498891 RepID=UPI00273AAAB5|nr:uncharacterized protein LOC131680696 [Topomyia yanbarensis]
MKEAKKVKRLLVRRNNLVGSVKLIKEFNANFVFDRDFPQLKFRLEKLDKLWDEFNEVQAEIECDEELEDEISSVRIAFETDFFQLKGSLAEKFDAVVPVVNRAPPSPTAPPAQAAPIRLPELKIPEFNGSFDEWMNFHDLFITLIHTNPHLSSVQKFQYLKAVLKGEALRLVQSLTVSAVNYTIAWDTLRRRYDNKNLQIKQHFSALLSTPAIRKESAAALSDLADEFDKHVCVLNKLENSDDHWNSFLIELLSSKLDSVSQKEWESQLDNEGRPAYNDLITFIQKRSRILQSLTLSQSSQHVAKPESKLEPKAWRNKTSIYHSSSENLSKCTVCKQTHALTQCDDFKKLSPQKRFDVAKKHGLCLNCLRSSHMMKNCTAGSCRTCNKRHHTLLHLNSTPQKTDQTEDKTALSIQMVQCDTAPRSASVVEPSSSVSCIVDQCHVVPRVSGSAPSSSDGHSSRSSSFVSPSGSQSIPSGLAHSSSQATNCQAVVPVHSHFSKNSTSAVFMLTAYVKVKNIDGQYIHARALLDCASEANFVTESLAQALRLKRAPANVDVSNLGNGLPVLRKTVFGYVVAGEAFETNNTSVICNVSTIDNMASIVRKFWEVESFESGKALSLEEQYCESHFSKTHFRAPDGRYVVRLPIREEMLLSLGESFTVAKRRFSGIERKLSMDPQLQLEYTRFMEEYQLLGHMTEAVPDHSKPYFYLPHHAIQRPESTTTKTRVVFDGSCRGSNSLSLNDLCYIGPTIQAPLLSTLLNFRLPKYAVTADVEKMYRQVIVNAIDRPLQQIIWRNHPNEELKTYRLNTVTYGTAPAPYLATRVLNQLAEDEANNYPLASPKVKQTFYVDDHLSGDDDEQRLIETNCQLIALLRSGGFSLRKWCSNSADVLTHIPESLRDTRTEFGIGINDPIKTLGLQWHPVPDHFGFNVPVFGSTEPITKRLILSEMSRLFDPLGLVGAVIVSAKIFLQSLWSQQFNWNDQLPVELQNWWINFRIEIRELSSLYIQRRVLVDHHKVISLHCFADASDRAYGSCIYVKTTNADGTSKSNLLISKSRVSPLTKLSTPRLELCAAVLAAQLAEFVLESTKLNCPVIYWTDSTIVLHWFASSSSTWKVFVSNRIAEIHRLTRGSCWRHVPTNLNPADRISRGVLPSKLVDDEIWWHGPRFICTEPEHWPPNCIQLSPLHLQTRELEARHTVVVVATTNSAALELIEQHSTLSPLQRKVAWTARKSNTPTDAPRRSTAALINDAATILANQGERYCKEGRTRMPSVFSLQAEHC